MRSIYPCVVFLVAGACASHHGSGSDDDAGPYVPDAFGPFADFPTTPIIDGSGAPANAGDLFGDPTHGNATGGPCLIEPEVGTVYPHNWIRPRFSWVPVGTQNLFEIRLTSANQINPLVVYTTASTWTMSQAMWNGLTAHTVDAPIAVTIRGATYDGTGALTDLPALGSTGDITIAPADAPGAIVYWTTSGGTGLRGFRIGDETVHDIVRPTDAGSQCIGCHSSTPDGVYVGFSSSQDPGTGDPTTLGMLTADGTKTTPPFITTQAQTLMSRMNQELPVFSPMHWTDGDHQAVTMYPTGGKFEIIWTNLETTSTAQDVGWGVLPRTGETTPAAYASFAHLSDNLLYVQAPAVNSGVSVYSGNLETVPFNAHAGGTPVPIDGAATDEYNEYYPTFSPDDKYVAYNRVDNGLYSYANDLAEVFVIPTAGGVATRLAANTPPMCSGKVSPGIQNSWPKWAPGSTFANNKTYYWLTFSSKRSPNGNPQLYVTPVIDDGTTLQTFPALYLWNQPADEHNHTPAWDNFEILQ